MLTASSGKDTGEVQVEAVLLVPALVPAHYLFNQRRHSGSDRKRREPAGAPGTQANVSCELTAPEAVVQFKGRKIK